MGKMVDISGHLTNERPTIKLSEDKIYKVNDRKNTMLLLNKKMESTDINDLEKVDKILEMLLGKKAVKEINDMDISFASYQSILIASMAAVMNEDYEVVEARFRQAAQQA